MWQGLGMTHCVGWDRSKTNGALAMMEPITDEIAYDAALAEIDTLMDAAPQTQSGRRLDRLVALVEAYEAQHWSIGA